MPVYYVDTLPTVIAAPGTYVLTADVIASGNGILIQSDDVTIDFNGHTLTGPTSADTTSFGVSAFGCKDITIENGAIDGFMYGIYLSDLVDSKTSAAELDGGGHLIESMDIGNATFRGIRVEGMNNVLQNNTIHDIGGSTVYDTAYGIGIETYGLDGLIDGNVIRNIRGTSTTQDSAEGVGISLTRYQDGTIVSNNTIVNDLLEPTDTAQLPLATSRSSYAVWVGGDGTFNNQVNDNTIDGYAYGITFKRTESGRFSGNTVTNAYVPYYLPSNDGVRVVDGGGNTSDMAADYLALRRATPGQIETVEPDTGGYLPLLHRVSGLSETPVYDLGIGDDTLSDAGGQGVVSYWGATAPVSIDLAADTASGAGNDTLVGMIGAEGGAYADTIAGDDNANMLSGAEGDDSLYGRGGADYLFGGAGNDMLFGSLGADMLDGGAGIDYARYDDASYGNITVSLNNAANAVIGTGPAAGDVFTSIEGLVLGSGNDWIYGDTNANYLYGGAGNDMLDGRAGDDLLDGGAGDDTLIGGLRNDTLTGGAGNDTFRYEGLGYGIDTVTDFQGGAGLGDVLDLRGDGFSTLSGVLAASTQVGADLQISFGDSSSLLLLKNVAMSTLVDDDVKLA